LVRGIGWPARGQPQIPARSRDVATRPPSLPRGNVVRQCSASPACRECRQLRSGCSSSSVEGSVTAVAERGIPRVLAPAQVGRLRIFRREDFWRESGSLVRAVTERLIGRVSAGTSGVPLPHLEFDRIGLLLSQFRLRHEVSSCEGSVAGQPLYRGARDGRQRSPLDSGPGRCHGAGLLLDPREEHQTRPCRAPAVSILRIALPGRFRIPLHEVVWLYRHTAGNAPNLRRASVS